MVSDCETLHSIYNLNKHSFYFEKFFTATLFNGSTVINLDGLSCPSDSRFFPGTGLLTNQACKDLVGNGWQPYQARDILTRLLTWKAPLVQLIFQFPRPPLGARVEVFSILHLMGDPVDTIASLLYTLEVCQRRVKLLREHGMPDADWKALGLIMASYDEIGNTEACVELERLWYNAKGEEQPEQERPFLNLVPSCCREKAAALAADRATTLLPSAIAQIIFILTYGIAYFRSFADEQGTQNWWGIEIHSIAFSLTVLWVIVAVLLGSLIGVSQSEQAVSRILTCLGGHAEGECAIAHAMLTERRRFWNNSLDREYRIFNGGVPSFQPCKWKQGKLAAGEELSARIAARKSTLLHCLFAVSVVCAGTVTAFSLSGLIPPEGFGPRHICQALMLLIWLISFLVQYLISKSNLTRRRQFSIVMGKDILSTACTASIILITQCGILNQCSSWSHWGNTPMMLPSIKAVHDVLQSRMKHVFPAIIFCGVLTQLASCAVIGWWYRDALRVFLQRDDGNSNLRRVRRDSWMSLSRAVPLSAIRSR